MKYTKFTENKIPTRNKNKIDQKMFETELNLIFASQNQWKN